MESGGSRGLGRCGPSAPLAAAPTCDGRCTAHPGPQGGQGGRRPGPHLQRQSPPSPARREHGRPGAADQQPLPLVGLFQQRGEAAAQEVTMQSTPSVPRLPVSGRGRGRLPAGPSGTHVAGRNTRGAADPCQLERRGRAGRRQRRHMGAFLGTLGTPMGARWQHFSLNRPLHECMGHGKRIAGRAGAPQARHGWVADLRRSKRLCCCCVHMALHPAGGTHPSINRPGLHRALMLTLCRAMTAAASPLEPAMHLFPQQ